MIDKIIEQIKKLSEKQIIEFAEKFNRIYEPIKYGYRDKTEELGDDICDILGVDFFHSHVQENVQTALMNLMPVY